MDLNLVDPVHEHSHYPPDPDDETFQESLAFTWVDPVVGAAGWHHFGLQRSRGVADINSYLSYRAAVIAREEDLSAPVPTEDFSSITVGTITRQTLKPLTQHRFVIEHGNVDAKLTMTAFLGPFNWSHETAPSHWESFGRVQGRLRQRDTVIDVSGWAFQDRSWGHRSYQGLTSCRIISAIFGPDLVLRVIEVSNEASRRVYGNLFENGLRTAVVHATITFDHDAHRVHLASGSADVWLADGRGLTVRARPVDHEIQQVRDGFLTPMSNCIIELGHRIGTGFILEMGSTTDGQHTWRRHAH